MRVPGSVSGLEELGRVRLSASFFMRDFLYSEVANFYGMPNMPIDPDLAIRNGTRLCEELLELLNATFGRIAVRSSYRSPTVNAFGNEKGHSCASNDANAAGHIWDMRDSDGLCGATACIVIPWFADKVEKGGDWRAMAYWIHNHLPYSELYFFPKLCAFNINWHEKPKRLIQSYIAPKGTLLKGGAPDDAYAEFYEGFPAFRRS
jgi:hypothetical protein